MSEGVGTDWHLVNVQDGSSGVRDKHDAVIWALGSQQGVTSGTGSRRPSARPRRGLVRGPPRLSQSTPRR